MKLTTGVTWKALITKISLLLAAIVLAVMINGELRRGKISQNTPIPDNLFVTGISALLALSFYNSKRDH